jgi:hypothetical protein
MIGIGVPHQRDPVILIKQDRSNANGTGLGDAPDQPRRLAKKPMVQCHGIPPRRSNIDKVNERPHWGKQLPRLMRTLTHRPVNVLTPSQVHVLTRKSISEICHGCATAIHLRMILGTL